MSEILLATGADEVVRVEEVDTTSNGDSLFSVEINGCMTSRELLAFAREIVDRWGRNHTTLDVGSELRRMRERAVLIALDEEEEEEEIDHGQ